MFVFVLFLKIHLKAYYSVTKHFVWRRRPLPPAVYESNLIIYSHWHSPHLRLYPSFFSCSSALLLWSLHSGAVTVRSTPVTSTRLQLTEWQGLISDLPISVLQSHHSSRGVSPLLMVLPAAVRKNKLWLVSTDEEQRKLCYLHFDSLVRLSLLFRTVKDKHAVTPKAADPVSYSVYCEDGYVELGNSYINR